MQNELQEHISILADIKSAIEKAMAMDGQNLDRIGRQMEMLKQYFQNIERTTIENQ